MSIVLPQLVEPRSSAKRAASTVIPPCPKTSAALPNLALARCVLGHARRTGSGGGQWELDPRALWLVDAPWQARRRNATCPCLHPSEPKAARCRKSTCSWRRFDTGGRRGPRARARPWRQHPTSAASERAVTAPLVARRRTRNSAFPRIMPWLPSGQCRDAAAPSCKSVHLRQARDLAHLGSPRSPVTLL